MNFLEPAVLVLATHNAGKAAEFQHLFNQYHLPLTIKTQKELNIKAASEDGLGFVDNALIKARHAARLSGQAALADDSGLCVPVLQGRPGIYSARFAGEHATDAQNNQALLDALLPYRGQQAINAYYACVLVFVRHAADPMPIIVEATWHGEILATPQGEGGFGYDALFWLPDLQQTAAQLTPDVKSTLSHRGQAMRELIQRLT